MNFYENGERDAAFMREALRQAQKAYEADEVPVGAVVVREGRIIARAYNQVELLKDATAHAEMLALTQAEAAVGDWRLTDCDLYVTKEPCVMCAGALIHIRVRRLIFGCADAKSGAAGGMISLLQHSALNHHCEITSGVLQNECGAILQVFFRKRRDEQNVTPQDRQIENRKSRWRSRQDSHPHLRRSKRRALVIKLREPVDRWCFRPHPSSLIPVHWLP